MRGEQREHPKTGGEVDTIADKRNASAYSAGVIAKGE